MAFPLEISVEHKPPVGLPYITGGKLEATEFFRLPKSKKKLMNYAYLISGEYPPPLRYGANKKERGENAKQQYQWLGEKIGYKFNTVWNGTMFGEWVLPHREIIYRLCFGPFGRERVGTRLDYSPKLLRQFWLSKDSVIQAEKDGIFNIAPLLMHYGVPDASPRMLKNFYGNGLWRKLSHQSLYRNKMLARFEPSEVSVLIDLPTTALKLCKPRGAMPSPAMVKAIEELRLEKKLKLLNSYTFSRMNYTIYDTRRMAEQLGEPFSEDWSYGRILEVHELYTQIIQQKAEVRRYGPNPFKTVCGPGTVRGEDFDLLLLDSPKLIQEEGQAMHHCVSSYIPDASRGDCSIYSLRDKKGNRLTTVQVYLGGRLGQHYRKYNASPLKSESDFVNWAIRQEHSRGSEK